MSQSEKDRLLKLEQMAAQLLEQIGQIKDSLATETEPGLVRLTSSSSVTDSTGLALSASENNAGLPGTIANRIESNRQETELRPKIIINKKPVPYTESSVPFFINEPGIYLASVSSVFVAGTVYILKRVNSGTAAAVPVSENGNYFKMNHSGGTGFEVRPNGVSGELTVIKIA